MVLQLLRQLIQRIVPGGAESSRKQQQLLQYCIRVLGSRISPAVVGDEFHLIELVKKRLIKENHTSSALGFTELYRRLSNQPALHRRWSILHVMFSLCSLQGTDKSAAFSNVGARCNRERPQPLTLTDSGVVGARKGEGRPQHAGVQRDLL